ncbi:MAG: hypothetical protein WED00_16785 [Aquisalimonadaceae bacterium]
MRNVFLLVLVLMAQPASAENTFRFHVDEGALAFEASDRAGSRRHWGVHDGAGYRIEVPETWNGTLIIYAHGFRGNDVAELTVTNPPLRDELLERGHAWAASSFSRNRYDIAAGVEDSRALVTLFQEQIGDPERVIVMGHDMGGHIAAVSAELLPDTYDGALPMCAPLGDTALFDYLVGFNLAAQAIAGVEARFPDPDFQERTRPQLLTRLGPDWPTERNLRGDRVRQMLLHLSGGPRPLFDEALQAWGERLFDFGHLDGSIGGVAGGNVVDTRNTVYRLTSYNALNEVEDQLNARVLRVEREPLTLRGTRLDHIPPITGEFTIPVLTLHTLGDLYMPVAMQQVYAERVTANGNPELLTQRVVRDIRHCTFSIAEQARALDDLLRWIEQGVKPEGDAVDDPEALADVRFGCRFTEPERPGLPACAQ